MKPLNRAVASPELLDEPQHDPHVLQQSLHHVAAVNRWLGGRRALLKHAREFIAPELITTILDAGTGSGDLPRALVQWARQAHRRIQVTATDLHPQMIALATRECADYPEISIQQADVLRLPFPDRSFDVALLSLTLHHFDEPEQLQIIRELMRVARKSVIVNELARTRLNYVGARLLASTIWRTNALTRHDGPLSVLRAFRRVELEQLARTARFTGHVHTEFFQRLVLVLTHD